MTTASHFSLLVVDDEPDLRTLYELTLLREGYDVETAGSVEDAWLHLKDRTYSAVITDMRLPDGTGIELLRRLEEAGRRERAIVITAYGSAENAVEALKAGAYDYLTKPVDLKQFRAVVASALGRTAASGPTVQPASLPSQQRAAEGRASAGAAASQAAGIGEPDRDRDRDRDRERDREAPVRPGAERGAGERGPLERAAAERPAADRAGTPQATSTALRRMAGDSGAMQQLRAMVDKVARSMAPVLVQGESGTGKELVARAIHEVSARRSQPFIAVNCGAIPEQLLEAEFFGYRKGAFTGAADDREGFFQAARGGTLFLDEIGDLPLSMQSKLLRSIQERAVRPVGAVVEVPVDVRIVSATHKDLGAEVHAGRFRQDLYYRLNVIQLRVPPLRERIDDLPAICERVLDRIAADAGVYPPPRLSREALVMLARHAFPGNVRELENLLHRAVALSGGELIEARDLGMLGDAADAAAFDTGDTQMGGLGAADRAWHRTVPGAFGASTMAATLGPPELPGGGMPPVAALAAPARANPASSAEAPLPSDLAAYLDDIERQVLVRALERHRYNRTAAGASMGLSLRQMRYRMARLGIHVAEQGVTLDEPDEPTGPADR